MTAKDPYTFKPLDPEATTDSEGNALPDGYATAETVTIAMAGARSSGKSVYIAVAMERLNSFVRKLGYIFEPTESTRVDYETRYRQPLFEKKKALGATPAGMQPPLIFDLGAGPVDHYAEPKPRVYLVVRDVAGEDMVDAHFRPQRENFGFFRHADTILFLYDPLEVERVNMLVQDAHARAYIEQPRNEYGSDPDVILKNIMDLMDSPDDDPHLSVVLSKFDTLQSLRRLAGSEQEGIVGRGAELDWAQTMGNYGLASRREGAPEDRPYDLDDAWILDEEVRSMLEELAENTVTNRIRQVLRNGKPLRHRFFAVSALGRMIANDARIDDTGIAPFRVLDPFRWVFHERNLLGQ